MRRRGKERVCIIEDEVERETLAETLERRWIRGVEGGKGRK